MRQEKNMKPTKSRLVTAENLPRVLEKLIESGKWSDNRIANRLKVSQSNVSRRRWHKGLPKVSHPQVPHSTVKRIKQLLAEGASSDEAIARQINKERKEMWERIGAKPIGKDGKPKQPLEISRRLVQEIRNENERKPKKAGEKTRMPRSSWEQLVARQKSHRNTKEDLFINKLLRQIKELPPNQKELVKLALRARAERIKNFLASSKAEQNGNHTEANKAKARESHALARFNLCVRELRRLRGEFG
jgi:uncharacterized protein YoaH (UPF0181 family)